MRSRLLMTSPYQPPTFETTVVASSTASSAAASSSTVRTASPVATWPPTADATASVARPMMKGTARFATAVSTDATTSVTYRGVRGRVKRRMRTRDATRPA